MLLEALKTLAERGGNYNLAFIGGGAEKEKLQAQADRLGLSQRVRFYGPSYGERELSTLIYNADLCVSPGNVGLTAIHAFSYGCPVITHGSFENQMPEFEAISEGRTGGFFKEGDADSLAAAVDSWFKLGLPRDDVRKACYAGIDDSWNPDYQIAVIKKALKIK